MTEKKPFYKSKTVWGFGIAILIAFAQANGIVANESLIANLIETFGWIFGVIGARLALQ